MKFLQSCFAQGAVSTLLVDFQDADLHKFGFELAFVRIERKLSRIGDIAQPFDPRKRKFSRSVGVHRDGGGLRVIDVGHGDAWRREQTSK